MIKSILFVTFDNEVGPCLASCSNETDLNFKEIAEYLLPKNFKYDQVLSVTTESYSLIGHPICISGSEYDRNSFLFNIVLILDSASDIAVYKRPISKIARFFRDIEVSHRLLSSNQEKLNNLIKEIHDKLVMSTEIHVEATSCDSLHLKIVDQMPLPPVSLSQVPILLTREPIIEENSASFLQYIDGITTLGQITEISGKLKILSFIEEFSFSRRLGLFNFSKFAKNTSLVRIASELLKCSPERTIRIYSLLNGQTMNNLLTNRNFAQIDIRRLYSFGLIHKIVKIIE